MDDYKKVKGTKLKFKGHVLLVKDTSTKWVFPKSGLML